MTACLEVDGLTVSLVTAASRWSVLRQVSLTIEAGESLGVVGESGAGKTSLALAILGLLPPSGRIENGSIRLEGRDLLAMGEDEMRWVRGREIGLVLQEPGVALDPLFTIGQQLAEALRSRRKLGRGQARERTLELLRQVAFPDAGARLGAYPFELSGGEQQRVMIAMALAGEPRLLICDEPTSALDVTVQAEIVALVKRLRHELSLSVLWIAHDLGVVAQTCDRVIVMYAGTVVEEASADELYTSPQHPYTQALLALAHQQSISAESPRGPLSVLPGHPVAAGQRFPGCAFEPRCGLAMAICRTEAPPLYAIDPRHHSRCHLANRGATEAS